LGCARCLVYLSMKLAKDSSRRWPRKYAADGLIGQGLSKAKERGDRGGPPRVSRGRVGRMRALRAPLQTLDGRTAERFQDAAAGSRGDAWIFRFSTWAFCPSRQDRGRQTCRRRVLTLRRLYHRTADRTCADERVVQAWRAGGWDPAHYSIAKFELVEQGSGTKIVFDHTGFPNGQQNIWRRDGKGTIGRHWRNSWPRCCAGPR